MFSKIIVNSPWYFFVLSFAFAGGLSLWLYFRNKKNSDAGVIVLRTLAVIRFFSTALLCLLFLNLYFRTITNETENPVLLLAIDNSSSVVATSDSSYIKGEFQEKIKTLQKNLSEKYSLKTLLFGTSVKNSGDPDFSEKETDIDQLILDIDNNYSNQNIGALILVSDGIYNKGANPLYAAEKLGFPVYSIALGDTNELRDVSIQNVQHNEVVYLGNNFPVEVLVRAKEFQGKEVTVSLLQNGISKGKQILKFSSDNWTGTATFTLSAETPGVTRYTAQVTILEGEKNKLNNVQSFVIEVIDNKEKILLLASAPHPDLGAIREALAGSPNYQLEYSSFTELNKPLKAYGLVILHGITGLQASLINECKTNKIPIFIVNPQVTDHIPGIRISGSLNKYNDSEPFMEKGFSLFTMSEGFKAFANELPAVKTFFGNYVISNSSNSLLNQRLGTVETDNPILFYTENDEMKSAAFMGDGLWKWRLRDFAENKNHNLFNELISKTVQYLSVKSDKSFFRISGPRIINENVSFELVAEVYNKNYELITDPDVSLTLTNSENKKFNYTFSKTNSGYRLNAGLLSPGEYRYEARVKSNNELFVRQGFLAVKEVVSEKINTVANHQVLFQLAKRSGGRLFYPKEIDQLEKVIFSSEQIKPITYTQSATLPLIGFKWVFWVILFLFSVEWFFRKRYLTI